MLQRSTITAVIVALVGVTGLVLLRRGEQATRPSSERALLIPADGLPVDAVTRIVLRRAGAEAMVFDRDDRGWMQVEPFPFPMDSFSIRQLVALGTSLEVARRLGPDEADPSMVGIQPPQAMVTCEWPSGALALEFGRRSVAGRFYVRVAGDPALYVVTGDLYERAVEMDPKEWRDRTIFPEASVDADEVLIDDGTTPIILRRQRKRWRMVEPAATRMDDRARDDFFSALGRARSGGFIVDRPGDPSRFGLDPPAASLEIRFSRPVQEGDGLVRRSFARRLLVGARMGVGSEDRFGLVEGRPVVVRLPEAVLRALFRPAVRLIDPTASGAMSANVKSIVIRGPAGELTFSRDLERWRARGGAEVDATLVERLLEQLTVERAAEIRIQPYPRQLQEATITLGGFDGRPFDTVRVARESSSGRWILENGDDVLRLFPAGTPMPLTPAAFGLTLAE